MPAPLRAFYTGSGTDSRKLNEQTSRHKNGPDAHQHRPANLIEPMSQSQDKNTLSPAGIIAAATTDAKRLSSLPPPVAEGATTGTGQPNWAAILEAARVRPTDEIEEDIVCLAIEKDGKEYTFGTMSNISTVTGRAKAKKTFAVSFAVAAAVGSILVLDRIRGKLPANKQTVLYFDTEQSRNQVLRVVKRICRLCDIADPPNLIVYAFPAFTHDDRLKAIDFAINNTPGIGLVIIDGVKDLAVDPVMESDQAAHVMTHLLQWSHTLNIHILCVLHQNKGDANVRGHLGTEIVNKSETVLSVTRDSTDKEISHVEPMFTRNQEFEPFCFRIDESGLPVLVEDEQYSPQRETGRSNRSNRPPRPDPDSMPLDTVLAILSRALSQESPLRYSPLRTAVQEAAEFAGFPLAKSRAETFIERAVKQNHLVKFKPEESKYPAYQLPEELPHLLPS